MTNDKVWFLTGASRGFGRLWAEAALRRGDRVAATARDVRTLDGLVAAHGDAVLPISLDVTDHPAVIDAVRRTVEHFGRLDVVVNNAGYGHFGAVEELSEDEIRAQMETNFFGALWVLQAALPVLRRQRSGHLVTVTSEGGVRAFPGIGAYHASKWAVEGLTQSLAGEVRELGIRVTNVEPGPYATGWLDATRHSAPLPLRPRPGLRGNLRRRGPGGDGPRAARRRRRRGPAAAGVLRPVVRGRPSAVPGTDRGMGALAGRGPGSVRAGPGRMTGAGRRPHRNRIRSPPHESGGVGGSV
ncbi:SDR family NAD(P)-dependent oxidoreductase [Pseudonocardia sp. ICBG601]|uniref:SDR family NAD(P)-dependent oxidoreductase n=1 Tax=Pseudonocardia sp. ICBG601 TaxID=2846759 RepID=UPI001CF605C4|nr:SDR family NAD(P)-dependent oxidoreductase [Pseudonocardia sp. ICBG601]